MIYLNLKTVYGIETVDQLEKKDFSTSKEFKAELNRLKNEYHMAGMAIYSSNRSTQDWKKK